MRQRKFIFYVLIIFLFNYQQKEFIIEISQLAFVARSTGEKRL